MKAFTPSLLCPHRYFQLLQIILLIHLLMALLLIPFQRAQSWILREIEQVFSSSVFSGTTLSKTSYNLKKKAIFFLEKWTGYQINVCETGLKGTTPCSQVIYSFILLLTSAHRKAGTLKQVQNVHSCPKNLPVSLVLIIIA